MSENGRPRGITPNKDAADLVRRIRRNHTTEELKSMWVNRSDDRMFVRIGMAVRGDSRDIGRLNANGAMFRQFATLGYEVVTASSKLEEYVTAEY